MFQQPAFTIYTAGISGKQSAAADDTVAGDDERYRISADGSSDSSDGVRVANLLGDLCVGGGLSFLDVPESIPDFFLEVGASLQIEIRPAGISWISEIEVYPSAGRFKTGAIISYPSGRACRPVLLACKVEPTQSSFRRGECDDAQWGRAFSEKQGDVHGDVFWNSTHLTRCGVTFQS
jgi:hypothetical protein